MQVYRYLKINFTEITIKYDHFHQRKFKAQQCIYIYINIYIYLYALMCVIFVWVYYFKYFSQFCLSKVPVFVHCGLYTHPPCNCYNAILEGQRVYLNQTVKGRWHYNTYYSKTTSMPHGLHSIMSRNTSERIAVEFEWAFSNAFSCLKIVVFWSQFY